MRIEVIPSCGAKGVNEKTDLICHLFLALLAVFAAHLEQLAAAAAATTLASADSLRVDLPTLVPVTADSAPLILGS
jgi:hypothetical protein